MTGVHRGTQRSGVHADPLAGRLLVAYLVSLVLHALLLFGMTGGWLKSASRPDPAPVYYVDLVHKPVLNPQAGRPEPRAAQPVPPAPGGPPPPAPPPPNPPPRPPAGGPPRGGPGGPYPRDGAA
jgi:hypothetical protein